MADEYTNMQWTDVDEKDVKQQIEERKYVIGGMK
jgi:hypothetical protein